MFSNFCTSAAHYVNKLLRKIGKINEYKKEKPKGTGWKAAALAIPLLVIALVAVKLNMPPKTAPRQNSTTQNTSNSAKPNQPIVTADDGFVLIKGGNTKGIAQEIQSQTGADIFETELVHPYSDDYDTVLDQAQHGRKQRILSKILNSTTR